MTKKLMIGLFAALPLSLFVACGGAASDDNSNAGIDGDTDEKQEETESEGTGNDEEVDDNKTDPSANGGDHQPLDSIVGIWAQRSVMSSFSEMPIIGSTQTRTIAIQKLVISGEGPNYTMRSQPCSVELDSGTTMVEMIIPNGFVQSLSSTESLLVDHDDHFEMPITWESRGVHLENIATDPLPTSPDDPRIFDQDGDGHPGMTVQISGLIQGDIYVIQRGFTALQGELNGDHFDGLVKWTDEQVTLGASNPILASNQPQNTLDPDPENSFFHSTRLTDDLSCDTILARSDALFAR